MISKIAPPQIRATTGLELAAGIFTKCSDELATQLTVSLTSGKKDSNQTPLRIGINGDLMGGMRAKEWSRSCSKSRCSRRKILWRRLAEFFAARYHAGTSRQVLWKRRWQSGPKTEMKPKPAAPFFVCNSLYRGKPSPPLQTD